MQPLSPADLLKNAASVASKDRAYGEYVNEAGHRCACYEGEEAPYRHLPGPPQYEIKGVYFCFAKFQNPFFKQWIGRYAAMAVFFPTVDLIHEAERRAGRPMMPPEWIDIKGAITTKPIKTTAKGLFALHKKAESWLRSNMIDEIDHRLVKATTEQEWRTENAELCNRYNAYEWARLGTTGKYWMKMHSATNALEMLRQTDYAFTVMPPKYEEPPKENEDSEAKAKAGKDAAGAMAALESVDTTAEQQEFLPEERKDLQ